MVRRRLVPGLALLGVFQPVRVRSFGVSRVRRLVGVFRSGHMKYALVLR